MWHSVHRSLEHASLLTYGSTAATMMFSGLHVGDIAMVVSATASVVGVGMQIYVAITKVRMMRRSARWEIANRNDGKKSRE